jgi:uncharacterized surface protein with fasciclin (FAS1) repeats
MTSTALAAIAACVCSASVFAGGQPATVVDVVLSSGEGFDSNRNDYDILLRAVATAELVEALSDPDADITVFAPNDRAFYRLAQDLGYDGAYDEEAIWNALVAVLTDLGAGDPIPTLTAILTYHVGVESYSALEIIILSIFQVDIQTLQGATIEPRFIKLKDNEPGLSDPFLALPLNVSTGNGVVHTINRVLIPVDLDAI